jgi:hypothetical protein
MQTFNIHSKIHRKWPDPNDPNMEHHIFYVPCRLMEKGIGIKPNSRWATDKSIKKPVGKAVMETLLNTAQEIKNIFHRMNGGITIVASMVTKKSDKNDLEHWVVQYDEEKEGILDGGHTYRIITTAQDLHDLDPEQYVVIKITTRVPENHIAEISEGLNTSLQVQRESILNNREYFDWIKEELKNESFYDQIAFKETDDGEYDISFILQLVFMMNPILFPNKEEDHPTAAYTSKRAVINRFEADMKSNKNAFKAAKPILKDILYLYEMMSCGAAGSGGYNDVKSSRITSEAILSTKNPKKFHIIDEESTETLHKGFLFPMFASFRWYIDVNGVGLKWKTNFDDVLKVWDEYGGQMLKFCVFNLKEDHSPDGKPKFSTFGKSKRIWTDLHKDMATKFDLR